jgi:hypothetical protein
MRFGHAFVFVASVALAAAFSACGSGSGTGPNPNPSTTPPPITVPTPTPPPDFRAQCGEPAPPPLYGMKVKINADNGFRKQMDSNPVVENTGRGTSDSYCGKVGFDSRALFCETRQEGHPQRGACDALIVGRASDTGRYGPTWSKDGRPCQPADTSQQVGCSNHPDNQFLAIARGDGEMLACASNEWPASGARCGGCTVSVSSGVCPQ